MPGVHNHMKIVGVLLRFELGFYLIPYFWYNLFISSSPHPADYEGVIA